MSGFKSEPVVDWLEYRLKDELKIMERRHSALLLELRSFLDAPEAPRSRQGSKERSSEMSEERDMDPTTSLTSIPPDLKVAMKVTSPVQEEDSSEDEEEEPQIRTTVLKETLSKQPSSLKEGLGAKQDAKMLIYHPIKLVRSSTFEVFFSALILLQALCLALETQYSGLDWGHRLAFEGYAQAAREAWPAVPGFLQATEILFGSLFLIECLMKMCAYGKGFFCYLWHWFDLLLVLLWCFDTVLAVLPVESPVLRLARLVRLIRLVKLVRAVQGFDSLIIMTTALKDSVNALFWVAMIMLVVEMMFALLLNQVLVALIFSTGHEYTDAEEKQLFQYFGTFLRAMLTMFQLTLGTWVPVARILQETVSPYFNIFTILHKVVVGFACIGVINGVFMQETLKVAQNDDIIMMREVAHKERTHARKMKAFFRYADHSKDHTITLDEWQRVMEGHHAQHWFAAQGLRVKDARKVFKLLDEDGSNGITMDELIQGVSSLQGPARSLDLAMLNESHAQLLRMMRSLVKRSEEKERGDAWSL